MQLKETVVISSEDIKMVEDFFRHYNDPNSNNLVMTEGLRLEIEKFKNKGTDDSYTVEDQKLFTQELCGALAKTTHPLLLDEAIKDVMASVIEVDNDAKFYKELELAITQKP